MQPHSQSRPLAELVRAKGVHAWDNSHARSIHPALGCSYGPGFFEELGAGDSCVVCNSRPFAFGGFVSDDSALKHEESKKHRRNVYKCWLSEGDACSLCGTGPLIGNNGRSDEIEKHVTGRRHQAAERVCLELANIEKSALSHFQKIHNVSTLPELQGSIETMAHALDDVVKWCQPGSSSNDAMKASHFDIIFKVGGADPHRRLMVLKANGMSDICSSSPSPTSCG